MKITVTARGALEVIFSRRSVRAFLPEPAPEAALTAIIEAAPYTTPDSAKQAGCPPQKRGYLY